MPCLLRILNKNVKTNILTKFTLLLNLQAQILSKIRFQLLLRFLRQALRREF
jgi:hypothetical protein